MGATSESGKRDKPGARSLCTARVQPLGVTVFLSERLQPFARGLPDDFKKFTVLANAHEHVNSFLA